MKIIIGSEILTDYCTKTDVKTWLPTIKTSDFDTEIDAIIPVSDRRIDNKLKNYTTVPLGSVPEIIKNISAIMSAGLFNKKRHPATEENPLLIFADKMLEDYIKETYKKGTLYRG